MNIHFPIDTVVLEGLSRGVAPATAQEDLAVPFAEGAKARHIVDLCAVLGLAAVFLDRMGTVFHASPLAKDFFGQMLVLNNGHLVASAGSVNDRIQEAVSKSLCAMGPNAVRRSVTIREFDRPATHLIAIDYPNAAPAQLLKVVVVLTRDIEASRADIGTLTRHLNRA